MKWTHMMKQVRKWITRPLARVVQGSPRYFDGNGQTDSVTRSHKESTFFVLFITLSLTDHKVASRERI